MKRTTKIIIALAAALCMAYAVLHAKTEVINVRGESVALHDQLRMMSFNVRRKGKEAHSAFKWKHRRTKVAHTITQARPDILGLQEATIDQIQDTQSLIKNKEYAWFGTGRGAQWFNRAANEYNPIFYRTSRLELKDSGTFVINPSGVNFIFKPKQIGLLRRICTWGKFRDKQTNEEFFVFNTHLDNKYHAARLNSLKNIMQTVDAKKTQLPIIFMGDFNTNLTPDVMNVLKNFVNTKDIAKSKVGPEETRTGWNYQELKKIDHILVAKNKTPLVVQHTVIKERSAQEMPADHRPVMVDVVLK